MIDQMMRSQIKLLLTQRRSTVVAVPTASRKGLNLAAGLEGPRNRAEVRKAGRQNRIKKQVSRVSKKNLSLTIQRIIIMQDLPLNLVTILMTYLLN